MPQPGSNRVNRERYDAVLFDLDGVITNTATLHATCWKQMFDEYLQKRATQRGEAFRPLISPRITDSTSMESRVSTAFGTSCAHAGSNSRRDILMILRSSKPCADWGTARMS